MIWIKNVKTNQQKMSSPNIFSFTKPDQNYSNSFPCLYHSHSIVRTQIIPTYHIILLPIIDMILSLQYFQNLSKLFFLRTLEPHHHLDRSLLLQQYAPNQGRVTHSIIKHQYSLVDDFNATRSQTHLENALEHVRCHKLLYNIVVLVRVGEEVGDYCQQGQQTNVVIVQSLVEPLVLDELDKGFTGDFNLCQDPYNLSNSPQVVIRGGLNQYFSELAFLQKPILGIIGQQHLDEQHQVSMQLQILQQEQSFQLYLKIGNFSDVLQAGAPLFTHDIMKRGYQYIHVVNIQAPVHFLRYGKQRIQYGVVIILGRDFGLKGCQGYVPVDELGEGHIAQGLKGVLF